MSDLTFVLYIRCFQRMKETLLPLHNVLLELETVTRVVLLRNMPILRVGEFIYLECFRN